MMAVFVLALLLGSAFSVVMRSFTIVEQSRDLARASQIMQSEMERLRTRTWDYISELPAREEYQPDSAFASTYNNRYTCYREVSTPSTARPNQRIVVLICTWTGRNEIINTRRYTAYFTEDGINDFYYRSF